MADPIRVDFQVGGIKDVLEAFKSATKAAKEFEKLVNKGFKTPRALPAGGQAAGSQGGGRANDPEAKRAREYEAYQKKLMRERERARERDLRAEDRNVRSATLAFLRGWDQAIKERTRKHEAEERKRQRATEQTEKAALRAAEQTTRRREQMARTITSTVGNSTSNAISRVAGTAGMVTGLLGGFTVADSVQKGLEARGAAVDLANQSGRKVSSNDILQKSSTIATTYGMDTTDVIKGLDAFVAKSGDVVGGLKGLGNLTELSVATGADIKELSQTAGIIHMATGDIGETMKRMRVLAGAGREGSVDMRELSQYAGRISAGANQFVSKGAAFAQLSAIVQQAAATGGATAAPEATEAVTRLATDVFEKQEAFAAYGIKTKDASGKYLVDPMQLIKQSIVKTGGDSSKLLELFGKMSYRAVAGFQDVYNRAGGGKKGEAAIDEAFKKFMDAELSAATVKQDAAERMNVADKQFNQVLNELREQVAAQVIPALVEMAPKVKELIPAFVELLRTVVDLFKWVADNPFTGLGGIVAAQVTSDLASAAIGQVVARGIAAMIAGSAGAGAGGAAGAAGIGARIAAAGSAVAVPAAIAGVGIAAAFAGLGGYMYSRGNSAKENMAADLADEGKRTEARRDVELLRKKLEWQNAPGAVDVLTGKPVTDQDRQATRTALEQRAKQFGDMIEQTEARKRASGGLIERLTMGAIGESGTYNAKQKAENAAYDSTLKDLNGTLTDLKAYLQKSEPASSVPPMLRPETTVSMSTPLRQPQ